MNRTFPVLAALTCAALGLAVMPAQADHDRGVSRHEVERAESRVHEARRALDAARHAHDDALRRRDGVSHELAGVRQELDGLLAHRDRESRRVREVLDDARRRLEDAERSANDVSRAVEQLSREADAARDDFIAKARRDRDYEDAVERLQYSERELKIAEERAVRALEQSYEWRAAVALREDAAIRLERVRQRYGAPEWTLQHAQREFDEAEARLERLRLEAVTHDYDVSAARRIVEDDQRKVDRLWDELIRDLPHDLRYRRAVDRLEDAKRDLSSAEVDVEQAREAFERLSREVDPHGGSFTLRRDIERLESRAADLSRELASLENRTRYGHRDISAAEARLHDATRDYQRLLAAYHRGGRGDRDRGDGRSRDRDRGNRYHR